MNTLTKTRRILNRGRVADSHAAFHQFDEDTGRPSTEVIIPRATYDDLGQPEQITVTIEPGDLLNP